MDNRSDSAGAVRRSQTVPDRAEDIYKDSCLHIEHKRYFFAIKGKRITLTRTEFKIISRLVRNIAQIVSLEDLWEFAWGPNKKLNRKSIQVFVSRVRNKLAPFGLRIDSVVGVGYILSHGSCCSSG